MQSKYPAPAFSFQGIKIKKVNRQTNGWMEAIYLRTFNQLSVVLHLLNCLMRNCSKPSEYKIVGFTFDYMEYYREEIFKELQGSGFLIHVVMQPSSDTEGGLFSAARHVS